VQRADPYADTRDRAAGGPALDRVKDALAVTDFVHQRHILRMRR
jgi:hypothetical protein